MERCCEAISGGGVSDDKTAILFAALNGHLDCLKVLISNGANINEKSGFGITPLQLFRKAK